MSHLKAFEHLKIQLKAIKSATNNFSDERCIGRGGFGKVYKGEIIHSEGLTMVAVKRLNRALGQGDVEFWKEIMILSQYKHENIVSLLGYCDECGENILVYEYIPKGSLDQYLNNSELTWTGRLWICIGVAHGLAYLHSAIGTQQRVLHRDIKSSNILLDENWNAKISDFGLSRTVPANQEYSFVFSSPVGTHGYCDPQYARTGCLTKESDVYSFGVVLFEVLCGTLSFDNNNGERQPLEVLVQMRYEENKVNDIVYANMKDEIDPDSLKVFTDIAYQCLKREGRPLMSDIAKTLEIALQRQVFEEDEDANKYLWPENLNIYNYIRPKTPVLSELDCVKSMTKPVQSNYLPVCNKEIAPEVRGVLIVTIHKGIDIKGKHPFIEVFLEKSVGCEWKTTRTLGKYEHLEWNQSLTFGCASTPIHLSFAVKSSQRWRKLLRANNVGYISIDLEDVLRDKHINKVFSSYSRYSCKLRVELQWVSRS